jgi:hypothetical protein
MKEGVAKMLTLLHIVSLLNMKWLGVPDVDGFLCVAMVNIHCSIGMDSGDGERTSSWHGNFWLTAVLIGIYDDGYSVTR